jgi:hypothetical protein
VPTGGDSESPAGWHFINWWFTHDSALGHSGREEYREDGTQDQQNRHAGIENFATLALEHNKDIRVIVQPIWLRWDIYEPTMKRPAKVDHNDITGEELRTRHTEHFRKMDEHIRELNKKYGHTVMYIAPAPQALIALREKIIAGKAPGLKTQEDLFTDALGHGTAPLKALVAYVDYATIYRRSPVGLPVPAILKQAKLGKNEDALNRLLQELAWDAVLEHPLSGLKP